MKRELFRAKEIKNNNDGRYIVSDSILWNHGELFLKDENFDWVKCDPNTRSVSYPNMIDKNDKEIFASLSEDGVGGDIVRHKNSQKENGFNKFTVIYDNWQIRAMNKADGKFGFRNAFGNEVIGIHKGE